MATNVVRYATSGGPAWGVIRDGLVVPIEGEFQTTRDFMLEGAERARTAEHDRATAAPLSEVDVLCPITSDRQFLCQAVNYHSHMKESGMNPTSNPFNIFFRKASSCLARADTDIILPDHVQFLDYEVELGLVFARDVTSATDVTDDNLHEYVGALVIVNDVSARDVQIPEMQFYKGKSYRTFGPSGPFLTLVDRDDLDRFDDLRLTLTVNGEVRQDSLTTDMVHRPPSTLTEFSGLQDWEAGDLLATGTPGGCALQAPAAPLRLLSQVVSPATRQSLLRRIASGNRRRLKVGDKIETSIRTADGLIDLGIQHNTVVASGS